jgi:hypothetical protein
LRSAPSIPASPHHRERSRQRDPCLFPPPREPTQTRM